MRKTLAAMALLTLLAACSAAIAQTSACHATAADEAAVKHTVHAAFRAAQHRDATLWNQSVTPDAIFFDGGREFHGSALFALIGKMEAAGHVYVWNPTQMQAQADCQMAWFHEVNVGSVDRKPMVWLESGALRKVGGQWKLVFLESQRAAAKAK
jgi:hypothetical protein